MILPNYSAFRAVFGIGEPRDGAGYERWPVEKVLWPSGAAGFRLVMPASFDVAAVLSVNDLAFDATPGVDAFDWYLSQRSDNPAEQIFTLRRFDDENGTRSGTVRLVPTALMTAMFALDEQHPTPSAEQAERIFKYVAVYVRRRADRAIVKGAWS